MTKVPELKTGQMITLAYIAAFAIGLFIVYKILAAVGLIKTAAAKKQEQAQNAAITNIRTEDYFKPDYLNTPGLDFSNYNALGDLATEYAKDIHDSIYGFMQFGTNAEKIFVTFGFCKNKMNIAEISFAYHDKYNRDLQADLLNNLTDAHLADLMAIIGRLPIK